MWLRDGCQLSMMVDFMGSFRVLVQGRRGWPDSQKPIDSDLIVLLYSEF